MEKRPKILVVDDKKENLFAVERVLRNLDVDIVTVTSGNDALKATLNNDFALALLDIQMPGMDGYELAAILREEEKTSKLPFIFISAVFTDPDNIFKGYEVGAFSFITKPFQPEILINKVQFFVDKHKHELELEQANKNLELKNKQLEEAYDELDSFTFSVSHNLQAPLRFIKEYVKIFFEDHEKELSVEGKRLLSVISVNAESMQSQLEDLLSFSQLGKQEIRKSEVDMNHLVDYVIRELTTPEERKRIEFKCGNLAKVFGDHVLLSKAVTALVSNALKFTSKVEKPKIEIDCKQQGEEIVYSVKDNGVGFDMQYSPKLFKIFQRLHAESEFPGRGVELAGVKRIINRHGGRVWADSSINGGSVFYFSLPIIA
jgi:two-component system, sensor histidine kinase and response regulator